MLTQFLSSYSDYHYKFLVFASEHGAEEEQQYIEELLSYQIEGLIVLSHTLPSEKLASYQIPVIAVEREAEYISSVNTCLLYTSSHRSKNQRNLISFSDPVYTCSIILFTCQPVSYTHLSLSQFPNSQSFAISVNIILCVFSKSIWTWPASNILIMSGSKKQWNYLNMEKLPSWKSHSPLAFIIFLIFTEPLKPNITWHHYLLSKDWINVLL